MCSVVMGFSQKCRCCAMVFACDPPPLLGSMRLLPVAPDWLPARPLNGEAPPPGSIMPLFEGSRSPKFMSKMLLDGVRKPACSTLAATLWWTTVFWSSLTMSIPSSRWSWACSSCGSDSRFSCDKRVPFTKVPFEDFTSLIQILPFASAHISACCLDKTLLSK